MELAASRSYFTTYATLPQVCDTFRLLIDSMDFSEKNGSGWGILWNLVHIAIDTHGEMEAKRKLLLWMLQLSSFELKTNIIKEKYAEILRLTIGSTMWPELIEASELLLDLGGDSIIDATTCYNGYTVLHERLAFGVEHGNTC